MKRVQKKSGLEEFLLLKYFHALFPNNIPRATVFDEEESIITMEYSESPTYLWLANNGKLSYKHLEDAIMFLIKLQEEAKKAHNSGLIEIDDVVAADTNYFINRALGIFGGELLREEELQIVRRNYWPISEELRKAQRRFHKDYNLGNICDGVVVFDFEKPRFLPAQFDLVNLLEFYSEYLSRDQICSLLGFYISESNKTTNERIDEASFLELYDYAAFHRHLEIVGYRTQQIKTDNSIEDLVARNHHMKRAKHYLRKMIEKEKGDRKEALENLDSVISALDFKTEGLNQKNFKVKRASEIFLATTLFLSTVVISGTVFVNSQVENRNIHPVNRAIFNGKNEAAIIKRTEEVIDGTLDVKYELYLTDKNYAERFGTVSNDCVSWSEDRNKVLFVEKRAYTVYDFRSGEKKPLSLRFDYGTCPVFFYGTSVVWNAVEMLFFNIEDSSIGKLVGDTNSFNELKGVIEKKIKTGNNEFSERILSPDGKKLAYLCGNQLCVEDGKTSLSINGKSRIWRFAWSRDSSGIFYFYSRREKFGEKEFPVMNVSFFDLHNKIETSLTFNEYPIIEGFLNTRGVEYIIK